MCVCICVNSNLIDNVQREFDRTGYMWEQYNDETGSGQRSHPFNGWTSLICDIVSETFE